MSIQVLALPSFSVSADHLEELTRGVSALTVDPFKNALYYFFPFLGAFFNNYQKIQVVDDLQAMMPHDPTRRILGEITDLTNCAEIGRQVVSYKADNSHQFSCFGGSYSLSTPALLIPGHRLYRLDGHSTFGAEREGENLRNDRWIFADDETRFLIARELGQIKENSALLRIAIKVSVLAALCTIYASPFGWPLGIALFIGVLGLYIVSERIFQARADIVGAQILGKRLNHPLEVAIRTLEKIRQQNIYRREHSRIARLYITQTGNNVLDFTHPYLTTRIERLSQCVRNS